MPNLRMHFNNAKHKIHVHLIHLIGSNLNSIFFLLKHNCPGYLKAMKYKILNLTFITAGVITGELTNQG